MASDQPHLLVTGGAGFVGSHTCVELLNTGHSIVVLDNLSNRSTKSLDAVRRITNRPLDFVEGDLRDAACLDRLFAANCFDAVIHFGGLKAVGESVAKPLLYYENNVMGTVHLISAMKAHSVKTLVFSSSATVYGKQSRFQFRPHARTRVRARPNGPDVLTGSAAETSRASSADGHSAARDPSCGEVDVGCNGRQRS